MVIRHKILQPNAQLVQIADTPGALRPCLGRGESWEQQGCEDGDDGGDNKQLD
jgi:hypothetical protein